MKKAKKVLIFVAAVIVALFLVLKMEASIQIAYQTGDVGYFKLYYDNGDEDRWDEAHTEQIPIKPGEGRADFAVKLSGTQHMRLDISGVSQMDIRSIRFRLGILPIFSLNSDNYDKYNPLFSGGEVDVKDEGLMYTSEAGAISIILPEVKGFAVIIMKGAAGIAITLILLCICRIFQKMLPSIVNGFRRVIECIQSSSYFNRENKPEKEYTKYAGLTVVVLAAALITGLFALYGEFDPHHEGFVFKTSLDVARGKVMFKETFSQYGALMFYINAVFIKIFGETVMAIRLVTVFMYMISFGALYLICRRFFSTFYSAATCLLTLGMAHFYFTAFLSWSSVYALAGLLLAEYFCLMSLEREKYRDIVLCAVFSGLTVWLRQPTGLTGILAFYLCMVLMILAKGRRGMGRKILLYTAVNAGVHILFMINLIRQQALADWWLQSFRMMGSFAMSMGSGGTSPTILDRVYLLIACLFPVNPSMVKQPWIWTILPLCSLAVFVGFLSVCIKKRKTSDGIAKEYKLAVIMAVFALASWHQYFPVNDRLHMYWAAVPMFPVMGYMLKKTFQLLLKARNRRVAEFIGLASMLALLAGGLVFRAQEGYYKVTREYRVINNGTYPFLNGIRLPLDIAANYEELLNEIESVQTLYPSKEIVNLAISGFYSSFSKDNITPYFYGNADYYDNNNKRKEFIKQNAPILIDYDGRPKQGYRVHKVMTGFTGNAYGDLNNIAVYLPEDGTAVNGTVKQADSMEETGAKDIKIDRDGGGKYVTLYNDSSAVRIVKLAVQECPEDADLDHMGFRCSSDDFPIKWIKNGDGLISQENIVLCSNAGVEIFYDGKEKADLMLDDLAVEEANGVLPIAVNMCQELGGGFQLLAENNTYTQYYIYYDDLDTGKKRKEVIYPFDRKMLRVSGRPGIQYSRKIVL